MSEPLNVEHDMDLVVTDMNGNKPIIKCRGGVDPRPSAEVIAKAIRERDNAVKELQTQEGLRLRALRLNNEYVAKLAEVTKERDELARLLELWKQQESIRRNQLRVHGLFDIGKVGNTTHMDP